MAGRQTIAIDAHKEMAVKGIVVFDFELFAKEHKQNQKSVEQSPGKLLQK